MKKICMYGALFVAPILMGGCFGDDDVQPGLEEKFLQETQIIDEYLQDNNLDAEVDSYSLLRYHEVQEGTGLAPYTANSVTMSYKINLLSTGAEVESVEEETIEWENLILGLQVGLRNVREGGRIILYIPSVVAYGSQPEGDIPANSILIYEIILHSFTQPQLKGDVNLIESYLEQNEIPATKLPSGVFYHITEEGDGETPDLGSTITIDYEGRLMNTQAVFDSGTGSTYDLAGLIVGWQLGLQHVPAGSDVTLYIPSTFAYGTTGNGSAIPPNSNLEFDITLKMVYN